MMKVALALTLIVALASFPLTEAREEMRIIQSYPGQQIASLMSNQPAKNIGSLIRLLKKRSSPTFYTATRFHEH